MRVKSYFSNTVEAAIAQASRELGEDALLVYSREATPETRYLGQYEVVFALAAADTPSETIRAPLPEPAAAATPTPAPLQSGLGLQQLADEIRAHRQSVDSLLNQSVSSPEGRPLRLLGELADRPGAASALMLTARLERAELDAQLLEDVMSRASRAVAAKQNRAEASAHSPGQLAMQWRSAVSTELERRLRTRTPSDWRDTSPRTIFLIGPPGSGKTTAAMQIAARLTGQGGQTPRLIAFEPRRFGWTQVLRSYASIVGAPFEVAQRGARLAELLAASATGTTIVDGPGLTANDEAAAHELEEFVRAFPSCETHLVLPATARTADLLATATRLARFQPRNLLFTRLDETTHWGGVWSAAALTGWELSYFAEGQRLPEDFRNASAQLVVDKLLTPPPLRRDSAVSAAPAPAAAPQLAAVPA